MSGRSAKSRSTLTLQLQVMFSPPLEYLVTDSLYMVWVCREGVCFEHDFIDLGVELVVVFYLINNTLRAAQSQFVFGHHVHIPAECALARASPSANQCQEWVAFTPVPVPLRFDVVPGRRGQLFYIQERAVLVMSHLPCSIDVA